MRKRTGCFLSEFTFFAMECQVGLRDYASVLSKIAVSEGQFDIVVREEMAQILEAFQKLSTKARGPKPYRPAFAIVICGKRHHARYAHYPFNHPAFNQSTQVLPDYVRLGRQERKHATRYRSGQRGNFCVRRFTFKPSSAFLLYNQLRLRLLSSGPRRPSRNSALSKLFSQSLKCNPRLL
jgi:hypothetical protein